MIHWKQITKQEEFNFATSTANVKTFIKPMGKQVSENSQDVIPILNTTDTFAPAHFTFRFGLLFHFRIDNHVNWITRDNGTKPNATPTPSIVVEGWVWKGLQ